MTGKAVTTSLLDDLLGDSLVMPPSLQLRADQAIE